MYKKIINIILKIARNPSYILILLNEHNIYHMKNDKKYIEIYYQYIFHKKLDLEQPVTFNEKLQWLKLYDRNSNYVEYVDKYEVKKHIKNLLGEQYVIPTVGVYNSFEKIDFTKLPNQFVIKCTHDSGGIVICKDKRLLNIKEAKRIIDKSLKSNYYYRGREWPYKNVHPRIIIEKYMEENSNNDLKDYKFFCFNGKVEFFKIDFDRYTKHRANYFDRDGNLLYFGEEACPPLFDRKLDFPCSLKKMIELAEILAKNMKFVRIDFYDIDGRIYFGEITFYPASGFGKFIPEIWDEKIGKLLNLFE